MCTVDNKILGWIDVAIATLSSLVGIIPGRIDDLALSFLKFIRNDETFLAFLGSFEAPPANAIMETPAAVTEAVRRWRDTEGVEMSQGSYMELIGYILNIIRWIAAKKSAPVPA